MRRTPFGEWNIVYYDREETTSEKILERLRAKGCARAKRVTKPPREAAGVRGEIENPIATPGDAFELALHVGEGRGAAVEVELPEELRAVGGAERELEAGRSSIYFESAPGAPEKRYAVKVRVRSGDSTGELAFSVELVKRVP